MSANEANKTNNNNEISIKEIIEVIWKKKIFIAIVTVSVLVLTIIGSLIYDNMTTNMVVFVNVEWDGIDEGEYPNGTTFDYLMVMNNVKPGPEFSKKMLAYYLEGLLKIIEKIETNELSEKVLIQGSSYFFNERTAKKLGFQLKKTTFGKIINATVNYLDLLWMYSIAKGKLTFPKINYMITVEIIGSGLVKNKNKLKDFSAYLSKK